MSTAIQNHTSARQLEGRPFDPSQVRYSPRWLSAGLLMASLAVAGARHGSQHRRTLVSGTGLAGLAGLAGLTYSTMIEPAHPRLERVALRFPQLPEKLAGLRIGQLSDMHLGHRHTRHNTRWAVGELLRERPDVIVITGDLVSFKREIAELPELLRPLHAPLGIYAVPGNHDHWEGLPELEQALQPLGIEFITNQYRWLEWRQTAFQLAGVDDLWNGQPDYASALSGAEHQFTILLSHAPDNAGDVARYGVDLQLSGHTHGGHVSVPLLGPLSLPRYGLKYVAGHAHVGSMQLYVSRGLGGMPLRFGCPPELTLFTLEAGPAS